MAHKITDHPHHHPAHPARDHHDAHHPGHPHGDQHQHKHHDVRALYEQGRVHPHGKSHTPDTQSARTFNPERTHTRSGLIGHDTFAQGHAAYQKPQAPEDRHDSHYDNDHANDWVRGAGEDATGKPNFDHSPSRDKMRR